MALTVLATSMLVALFSARVSGPQEKNRSLLSSTGPHHNGDTIVMLQGKLQAQIENEEQIEDQIETLSNDTGLPNASNPQVKPSNMSSVAMRIQEAADSLRESVSHLVERAGIKHMSAQASTGITIVMVILGILLCGLVSMMICSGQSGQKNNAQSPGDMPNSSRPHSFMALPGSGSNSPESPGTLLSLPGALETKMAPPSASVVSAPVVSAPRTTGSSASLLPSAAELRRALITPPSLCPTLPMPASETLLGISMYELAKLGAEGALNVVGISGKPLLRAVVKRVGGIRSLVISMPDPTSTPQATIAPPEDEEEAEDGRALEIKGRHGVFYGILQMQGSGACYVVKDGQTVLTLDGDADSLQLVLKSGNGKELAAVKCSNMTSEGVEHVKIRVEPGMDTVLVIAVVLAVMLLSPYRPSEE